jgi:putative SOS response-associated peptidase YedK
MINARSETVTTKPAYREAVRRRRCLIPADSFYEWQLSADGPRRPYAIARADGGPIAFAGLWDAWRDRTAGDGPWVRTCAIVTTTANDRLRPIHERMPVVLAPDAWDGWLDPANQDLDRLVPLLVPAPDQDFVFWRVSNLVNKATNEGPELVEPVEDDRSEPNLLTPLGEE